MRGAHKTATARVGEELTRAVSFWYVAAYTLGLSTQGNLSIAGGAIFVKRKYESVRRRLALVDDGAHGGAYGSVPGERLGFGCPKVHLVDNAPH